MFPTIYIIKAIQQKTRLESRFYRQKRGKNQIYPSGTTARVCGPVNSSNNCTASASTGAH